jgi:hypothetical protein
MSGNEKYYSFYKMVITIFFFPQNILNLFFEWVLWGGSNILAAKFLVSLYFDFALISFLSSAFLITIIVLILNIQKGEINKDVLTTLH